MHSIQSFALAVLLLSCVCRAQGANNENPGYVPKGFSLQWEPDFDDDGILQQLEFTDAKAWRRKKHAGRSALELVGDSRYTYKVRSPSSIALLTTRRFGDFLFEAELMQTGRDYGHRDLQGPRRTSHPLNRRVSDATRSADFGVLGPFIA